MPLQPSLCLRLFAAGEFTTSHGIRHVVKMSIPYGPHCCKTRADFVLASLRACQGTVHQGGGLPYPEQTLLLCQRGSSALSGLGKAVQHACVRLGALRVVLLIRNNTSPERVLVEGAVCPTQKNRVPILNKAFVGHVWKL